MSLFKDMLGADETLFRNDVALDFSYQPKVLKYRDNEQRYVAGCLKPLLMNRNAKNLFVYGKPGIGKTVAINHVLNSLEEEDLGDFDEVYPIYVNCWQKNTTYKVILELCEKLEYKFTQNKKTEDLFKVVANIVNRKAAVFVFDEVDKCEDMDFLYTILEQIYKKSIILITNHKDFILKIEDRVKSRLAPDMLEFNAYNQAETRGILEQRKEWAFLPEVWDGPAFEMVVQKTFEAADIRSGLHLMKESGLNAESASSKKILAEHVENAVGKIDEISVKNQDELDEECRFVLKIVKDDSGKKIGELYKNFQEAGGKSSYKTFQRKVQKLSEGGFVTTKKVTGGTEGSTTIVNYLRTKKLTDF